MRAQIVESELVFKETTSGVADRRVALIQRGLNLRQGASLTIDGLFGHKTSTAVKKFQKKSGLHQSGVIDKITGRKMGLPFWDVSVLRTLETPFRDEDIFDRSHEFVFRSTVGAGYFYSSWPDEAYDSTDTLTWRALRTNNPGAINISDWQMKLSGYVGKTYPDGSRNKNRTTIYQTPEDGVSAWGTLLRIIYFKGSKDKVTIGQIIDKYRGGNPRADYLKGYKRFSNGELTEDFEVDLYDNNVMKKVAIASYSHEFGSWYPLLDEQLLAGLAISDAYVSLNIEKMFRILKKELNPSFYRMDELPESGGELQDGSEDFEENLDTAGADTSLAAPQAEGVNAPPPRLGLSDARWPKEFKNAPDMWHINGDGSDVEFELTYAVVKRLLEVGCFDPDTSTNGKFILALRGCVIADGSNEIEDSSSIKVRATKPNHEDFLCSIGVINTSNQTLSFYKASTVPRRTGMLKYYNKINFGISWPMSCNMLPTGCYEYCVGTHHGQSGEVSFVLRLGNGPEPESAGAALVLRTTNDLIYGTQDTWDPTTPGDNIHPAFLAVSFSSVGCLTLHGYQKPGGKYSTATKQWKSFRKNLGFEGELRGKRFDTGPRDGSRGCGSSRHWWWNYRRVAVSTARLSRRARELPSRAARTHG